MKIVLAVMIALALALAVAVTFVRLSARLRAAR